MSKMGMNSGLQVRLKARSGGYGVDTSREILRLWARKKGGSSGFECLDRSRQSVWRDDR
jgi:hypothetical protein